MLPSVRDDVRAGGIREEKKIPKARVTKTPGGCRTAGQTSGWIIGERKNARRKPFWSQKVLRLGGGGGGSNSLGSRKIGDAGKDLRQEK